MQELTLEATATSTKQNKAKNKRRTGEDILDREGQNELHFSTHSYLKQNYKKNSRNFNYNFCE